MKKEITTNRYKVIFDGDNVNVYEKETDDFKNIYWNHTLKTTRSTDYMARIMATIVEYYEDMIL